jgi:H+/Cl- antiporter ClcA
MTSSAMRTPMKLIAPLCAALALAVAGTVAAPALAAGGNAIINDCESNGQLTTHYSLQALDHALAVMPASVKQYTDCYDVIARAIATAKTRSGTVSTSTGGSGGSFLPTPVIIILVVLILAGVTFGAIAVRRRQAARPSDGPADGGRGPDDPSGGPSGPSAT